SVVNYMQITYATLPSGSVVESFDPSADTSAEAARLGATGVDPKGSEPDISDEVEIALAAAQSQTVWEHDGPETIVRFELFAPERAEIPLGLRLQIAWDGASAAQVDAPLDELFAASLGAAAGSIAYGRDGDRLYVSLPMPFHAHAQIVLRNDGD